MHIPPPGMVMGQQAKKFGWNEECVDRRLLVRISRHLRNRKISRYDLDMRGFSPCDKFQIIAVLETLP
jgi:hypothetical protein